MRARELFDFGTCATAWRAASSCVNSSSFLGCHFARESGPECGPPKRKPAFASPPSAIVGGCGTQSCGSAVCDGAAGPSQPERLKPIPLNSQYKAWFVLPKWGAYTTYDCNQVSSNPQFIGLVPCPGPRRMDSADARFSDCQRANDPSILEWR